MLYIYKISSYENAPDETGEVTSSIETTRHEEILKDLVTKSYVSSIDWIKLITLDGEIKTVHLRLNEQNKLILE